MARKIKTIRGAISYLIVYEECDSFNFPLDFDSLVSPIRRMPMFPGQLYSVSMAYPVLMNEGRAYPQIHFVKAKDIIDVLQGLEQSDIVVVICNSRLWIEVALGNSSTNTLLLSPKNVYDIKSDRYFSDTDQLLAKLKEITASPLWVNPISAIPPNQLNLGSIQRNQNLYFIKNQITCYVWSNRQTIIQEQDGPFEANIEARIIANYHVVNQRHFFNKQFLPTLILAMPIASVAEKQAAKVFSPIISRDDADYGLISYLHSLLMLSPCLCFGKLSEDIYNQLLVFAPKDKHSLPSANKTNRLMERIGKQAVNEIVTDHEKEAIMLHEQICAISDFPAEWMHFDGVPLAFSHDVCRVSSKAKASVISHFVRHTNQSFSISENITEKTHVVMCAPNDPVMKAAYGQQIEAFKKIGFVNYAIIDSISGLSNYIKLHKPEILIFDCHGDYIPESSETILRIGNESLNGELVIKNHIVAPIIFLSACCTGPANGIRLPISDSFFERGALAVTATMVPMDILQGSMLILRLINNLTYAQKNGVHRNWLSFVSHLTRTFFLTNIIRNDKSSSALCDYPESELEIDPTLVKLDQKWRSPTIDATKTMIPEYRNDIYKLWKEKCGGGVPPEHLFYTHLGRMDLIGFDSWFSNFEIET
ncbi:MAG: hypothetical protein H6686_09170 [Fibrobacteria bacterium]|nr:hypothetical protein [Fibrobacteria bacterium]